MQDEDEVIIANAIFDAEADNYEEFDLEIDPEKLGDKLVQTNTLKGTVREFQHYSSNHLLLSLVKKKKAETKNYRVNLPGYRLNRFTTKLSYGNGYTALWHQQH